MFKLPCSEIPKSYENIERKAPDSDDPRVWATRGFSGFIQYHYMYIWNFIANSVPDRKKSRSLLTDYSLRIESEDLNAMLKLIYETDEVDFPFILVVSFALSRGAELYYYLSKIAMYKSDETCTEIHSDAIHEACFDDTQTYITYARTILKWMDEVFHKNMCDQ